MSRFSNTCYTIINMNESQEVNIYVGAKEGKDEKTLIYINQLLCFFHCCCFHAFYQLWWQYLNTIP